MKRVLAALALLAGLLGAPAPAMAAGVQPNGHPVAVRGGVHPASLTYFYGGAHQTGISNETSVTALLDPESPAISAGDFHSLGEIAVRSTNSQQVVEIGWTVDPTTWGDSKPRLFIYHWVNGTPICYTKLTNLCGFVLYSGRATGNDPGQDLTALVGMPKQFTIQHFSNAWWVAYDYDATSNDYIGSFPDTLWSGATPSVTFTSFQNFDGFGEVAANSSSPCTNMGKGFLATGPTSPTGAGVTSVTYSSGSAAVNLTGYTDPQPTWYNNVNSSVRSVRYGGPGAC